MAGRAFARRDAVGWPVSTTSRGAGALRFDGRPPAADLSIGRRAAVPSQVFRTKDVPLGEGRAVEVDDRPIAVFRTRQGWYAIDQHCPHRGGPLADGIVADGCVTCPLHDRRFELATGRCQTDEPLRVATYPVEVRGGEVWVDAAAMDP